MKRTIAHLWALAVASVLGFALTQSHAFAQDAAPAPAPAQAPAPAPAPVATDSDDNVVVLSPFVVDASEDKGSYQAQASLGGTGIRTNLKDIASATSVVTQQFLQDTAVHNSGDLLVYTPNTEVTGLNGNYSGQAGNAIFNENTIQANNVTRVRGLDTADDTRDFFLTDIPWDSFNVGRVDLERGPNSILFGVGSPAGIVNNVTNTANFHTAYNVTDTVGSFGSLRNSIDLNQVIAPGQLAIRFSALNDDEKFEQKQAWNNDTRYFAALRFDPKVLNAGDSHTSIAANWEHGVVNSDNPRDLPPVDEITPWFQTGTFNVGGVAEPALNKLTVNQYAGPGAALGASGGIANNAFDLGGWAQGRTYWGDPLSFFNGGASSLPQSGVATKVIEGEVPQGDLGNFPGNPANNGGIGSLPSYIPAGIEPFNQYAANVGNVPGGVYYADKVLTDPSVFNFYKNLLDGPNKSEWQNWNAINVSLTQSFWGDRLAFNLAFDHQDYNSGQVGFLSGNNYAISVDVNQTLSDGTPNPNVGRPYVANSAFAGGDSDTDLVRNTVRFKITADVNAKDYFGNTTLAWILGDNKFYALWDEDKKTTTNVNWSEYGTTVDYENSIGRPITATGQNERQFDWVDYIGPSLAGSATAAGANLSPIMTNIAPLQSETVEVYNSHWTQPTNPAAPGYVNPTAAYDNPTGTYPLGTTGQLGSNGFDNPQYGTVTTTPGTLTQADNYANYVGWQNESVDWLSAKDANEFADLVTGASRYRYEDVNEGIVWQGYLLGGALVPTLGWRQDSVSELATAAQSDPLTGVTPLSYSDNPASRTDARGISKSWGGVYHLPKALVSKIPGDTDISIFYDRSSNFKADVPRTNLEGGTIPNATGATKEYGFRISTLDDKLTLKVDWYHTAESNATFDATNGNSIAGLGGNGYYLWAYPAWGYFWAAQLQDQLQGETTFDNYSSQGGTSTDFTGQGGNKPPDGTVNTSVAQENAYDQTIVNAWLKLPVPNSFFNYYGINPISINPAAAQSSGLLRNAFSAGFSDTAGFFQPGGEQPGPISAVSTVDTLSTGQEYELTAHPIKNWNLTVNYSRTFATHTEVDPATQLFMSQMNAFMAGPGGSLRMWGNGEGNYIGTGWNSGITAPYAVELNSIGKSSPEVAPWRLNGVTTYTFDNGILKNLFIGGGLRVEAGKIIGYAYSSTFVNANGQLGGLDVNQPFIGSVEKHVDGWLGYKYPLTSRINWRIQANIRNIGESDQLVADRINPDGSLALARIEEGMTWQLTNSFDF